MVKYLTACFLTKGTGNSDSLILMICSHEYPDV